MFDHLLNDLNTGISIQNYRIYRSKIQPGRTSHEKRITVFIHKNEKTYELMDALLFSGIKPWYQPWIELIYPYDFSMIAKTLSLHFFDSILEKKVLNLFCTSLSYSAKIFVSYEQDDETRTGLMMHIPEVITRLGFLLYSFGFTWYKDWYFPEGGFEGGQKLQGEKPLDEHHKNRQMDKLYSQVSDFVFSKTNEISSSVERKAINRGKKILNTTEKIPLFLIILQIRQVSWRILLGPFSYIFPAEVLISARSFSSIILIFPLLPERY